MNRNGTRRTGSSTRRFVAPVAMLFGAWLLVSPVPSAGAFESPAPVGLGDAGAFSVLAATTVTNSGDTVITGGNVGVSPGSAVTGFPPGVVTPPGEIHTADAVASGAQDSLGAAYNDAAGRAPNVVYEPVHELGGSTLTAGVYNTPSSFAVTGSLTLDAEGNPDAVFIFQAGSTLTTAAGSSIVLTNGAQACNVFWAVGSSATLGGGSSFSGTIMASVSISLGEAANVSGRLLASTGAVTLLNNQITTSACVPDSGISVAPLLGRLGSGVALAALAGAAGFIVVRRRNAVRNALPSS